MKKLIDRLKDVLYDSMDVVLVVAIFLVVGGTILWRLDVLFTPNMDKEPLEQSSNIDGSTDNSTDNDGSNPDNSNDSTQNQDNTDGTQQGNNDDGNQQNGSDSNTDSSPNDPNTIKVITVKIPEGALAPTIADILINNGLIAADSKFSFLARAQQLGLDTKFKPGVFQIKQDASVDTIIKIIAKSI